MQSKNLIFLTMARITDIRYKAVYTDLLRKIRNEGWNVYVVMPHERSLGKPTELKEDGGVHFLGVKTLNLQKTSPVEKGLGQVLVESQYKAAIKKYLSDLKFDLILYSTPPITFSQTIAYLKRKNPQAMTYLLLKDIFPQNAVDIGMMSKSGFKGLLYKFFRKKEKKLYALSDFIGCMSPANVNYIIKHNPKIDSSRVEVAPNSIELVQEPRLTDLGDEEVICTKYRLPQDKPKFLYGGNLGKPQGIPFMISCFEANSQRKDCHFIVIGSGTEYDRLEAWYNENLNHNAYLNVTLIKWLPKDEYDQLVRICDVGLIFLDHRFTIPNFPSRLLSYLENKMPILCATDPNTDIGQIAEDNGFGFWCESNSVAEFTVILDKMIHADRKAMGERGYAFMKENYLVENTYNAIVKHLES